MCVCVKEFYPIPIDLTTLVNLFYKNKAYQIKNDVKPELKDNFDF